MFTKRVSRKEQAGSLDDIFEADDTNEAGSRSTGYMAELEEWLDEAVFEPIERAIADEDTKELHIAFAEAKQHIKRKVLASYHNGLKAKQPQIKKTYERSNYRRN